MNHRLYNALRRALAALVTVALVSCATAPETGISLRPIPKPTPPDPLALTHFVNAKLLEMRGRSDRAIVSLRAAIAIDTSSATLYRALARNFAALNQYAEATIPASRALALDRNDLPTRWIYHDALLKELKDTTAALTQLEILVKQEPEPIKVYQQMLNVHAARKDNAAVLTTLDRITELPDLNEAGKLIAAQNYQARGANTRAERLVRNVLATNPSRGEAWVKLANLQVLRGDTLSGALSLRQAIRNPERRVDARKVWQELVRIYGPAPRMDSLLVESPPDTAFQEQLGEVFRQFARSGNPQHSPALLERSFALFNNISRLSPRRADLYAKQGELLLNLNRPRDARTAFLRASQLDNDRPEYHLGAAHTMLYERLYEPAIQILERIKPLFTPKSEFYEKTMLSLGNAYSATGQNEKARRTFHESIEASPDNTNYPFDLAETYIREGNWDKAADGFRALVPRVEKDPIALGQTLYGLARSLERSGEFDESVRHFERLLSLHPNHADALNYLGYMFAERGVRLGEAENFIKRALESDPNNGAYLDSLGWVYFQTGDYRRAQELLQKAIAQEEAELRKVGSEETARLKAGRENLAVIYDHAGDCALAINQFSEARKWWRLALENDPNIENTRDKLQELDREHPPNPYRAP
jgi:tetratricopeptide (TPR) repeat protein